VRGNKKGAPFVINGGAFACVQQRILQRILLLVLKLDTALTVPKQKLL
jgi:hypothetical protein